MRFNGIPPWRGGRRVFAAAAAGIVQLQPPKAFLITHYPQPRMAAIDRNKGSDSGVGDGANKVQFQKGLSEAR
jgi:hypothetical protein